MTYFVAEDLAGALLFLVDEGVATSAGRSIKSSILKVTTVVTVPSSSSTVAVFAFLLPRLLAKSTFNIDHEFQE